MAATLLFALQWGADMQTCVSDSQSQVEMTGYLDDLQLEKNEV